MNAVKKLLNKYKDKNCLIFFDKLIYRIGDKNLPAMAGSLTFFTMLSIFPFIIAFLNIISFVEVFDQQSIVELLKVLPEDIYKVIDNLITQLTKSSSTGLLSISLFLGILSASSGVKQLIININKAYGIVDDRNYFFKRLIAAVFTLLLIVMIILVSLTQLVGRTLVVKILNYFEVNGSNINTVTGLLNYTVPIIYMFILFVMLYYLSLNKKIRRHLNIFKVLPGAIFSTIGLNLFTGLFGIYLQNFAKYSVTYGSLGSIFALLTWGYFMSYTMLIGGEINGILFSMKNFKTQNLSPRYESVLFREP